MKNSISLLVGIVLFLLSNSSEAMERYKCFLETSSLDRTPVAIIHSYKTLKSMKWSLEVIKSPNSYRTIFEAPIVDNTDKEHAMFISKTQGVSIGFYLDEADALGFREGTMKSPVMSGNIKCLEVK